MIRMLPNNIVVAYSQKGKDTALSCPSTNRQLAVFNARAQNNSGGAINCGILRKLSPSIGATAQGPLAYKLWLLTTGGTVYTESAITSATLGTKQIFTTTNNDGFLIQSPVKLGMIGFTVSSAGAGGTFTYTYWNGTSMSTLTTIENPTDYSTTGDKFIVFRTPYDAVVGAPAGSGLSSSLYTYQVKGTTAPGSAVSITSLWLGEFLAVYSGVANNAEVQLSFPDTKPFELNANEGLYPYFGTANAANQFSSYYAVVG